MKTFYALMAGVLLTGIPQLAMAGGCGSYAPSYSAGYSYAQQSYYYPPKVQYTYQPTYTYAIPVVLAYYEVPLYSVGGTGQRPVANQTVSSTTTTTTTASASAAAAGAGAGAGGGAGGNVQALGGPSSVTATANSNAPCMAETKALREELNALRADLLALRGPAPQAQNNGQGGGNFRVQNTQPKGTALGRACAACHTAATAEADGGGKVLVAGSAGQEHLIDGLNPVLLNKILTKTYSGAMPPQGNKKGISQATDSEVAEIVSSVERYNARAKVD